MSEPLFASAHLNKEDRKGIAAAAKYNPHLWSADELRAIFVARQKELAAILQALRSAPQHTAPQHLLITGQRGMGKSTLLQRVALGVEEDAELAKSWIALRFPEEQYTVTTPAELWVNVMGALADALERQDLPTLEIDADIARLTAMPTAQRESAALAWLQQWCDDHKRRLLMLMDSTDLLFANLAGADNKKSQALQNGGASALWRVRKELLHSPHMLWLGGSYQPLEVSGLYSDAFLDFFQLIELRPLSLAEMQTAIEAMARIFGAGRELKGEEAVAELKRLFAARPERLRAMRQLTGGIPRTTVMLYELFAAGGQDSVRADLERLLDAITPLYKARLEVLADQPRKVLAHVMESWAPITAKDLARASALPVGTVSAQLTRLEQEGLVEKTAMRGTKRLGFQVSERFFNIWYLMRNAPRGARARVGWLVEFMRLWYSRDELQGLARVRWNEHRNGIHCDASELEYSRAIARALPANLQVRRQLDWAVFQQARKGAALAELFELQGEDSNYSTHQDYLQRFDVLREHLGRTSLQDAESQDFLHELIRAIDLTLLQKEHLAKACKSGLRPTYAKIRHVLQTSREKLIAEFGVDGVVQVEDAITKGQFFPECNDPVLAHTQIMDCFAADSDAFVVALDTFASTSDDPQLEITLKEATALSPQNPQLWKLLGDHLETIDLYEGAESAYRNAIEIAPNWAEVWGSIGELLRVNLNRPQEAETAYRKAIEIDPKLAWVRGGLGDLLHHDLDRSEEAEASYRQVIALDSASSRPWAALGNLLSETQNREADAEAAYREAIQLDPKDSDLWSSLGDLLSDLGDRDAEAEECFQKAIDCDSTAAWPWFSRACHISLDMQRSQEAERGFLKAIELDNEWAVPWNALGVLLNEQVNRQNEAETAYRNAVALNPSLIEAVVNLAQLLARQKRTAEANTFFKKVIALAGESDFYLLLKANCWLGNSDLALNALDALAEAAIKKTEPALFALLGQSIECYVNGTSELLIKLMEQSRYADFLQPFALALRAANGEKDVLLDAAVEVRSMAEEVLRQIKGAG